MPGKIIKLFDTKEDWESGTLSNMDSTTKPGSIAPNPSFSKTYTVGASLDWYNWKQGAYIQFLYEEGEMLNPTRMSDGDISTYAQKLPGGYVASMKVTYASAHQFSGVRIYQGPLAKGRVRLLRGTAEVFGWTSLTASGGWKTINFSSAQDTIWKLEILQDTIIYEIDLLPTDYYITPKTWTSSWTAFGISGTFTSAFTLNATIPTGTSVKKYVRYSATGQDSPAWQEITGSSLPGTGGNYIQFKLDLATTDTSKTPTVSSFSVTAGPEVYWISPVIDTSKSKSDRLTIGVETDMDIKRSIKASNYTFSRSSTAYLSNGTQVAANVPRFEQGKFGKAILIEEGTENLLNNPTFEGESGVASCFVAYGSEVNYEIVNDGYLSNTLSQRLYYNSPTGDGSLMNKGIRFNITGQIDDVFTITFYGKGWEEKGSINIYMRGALSLGMKKDTLENGWAKYTNIIKLTGTTCDFYIRPNGNMEYSFDCLINAPQVEKKPYPTSFIAGTRAAETLTIPTAGVLNPQEGTVELVIIPQNNYSWTAQIHFEANAGTTNKSQVFIFNEEGYWLCGLFDKNKTVRRIAVPYDGQQGVPTRIALTWKNCNSGQANAEVKLYKNGVPQGIVSGVQIDMESAFTICSIGRRALSAAYWGNAFYDDLRISSRARTDEEIAAAYQSGQPVGFDAYTTYYEPFDASYYWQVVGVVFENPHTVSLQVKIEPSKTKVGTQYIDSLGLWDTITLPMLERPDIEIAPPECNKITVYTDTIEKSATVPGTSSDRIVEIRVEAPEGSSEAYCQQMADAILAAKSKERLSITCKVPLVTSLRFGELVPVILPYIGATIDTPYLAHVQRMEHHILENPPYTILSLGDFLPDDIEALVRLLKEG